MSDQVLTSTANCAGYTCLAFARDGSRIYTGGSDSLVRIWKTDLGTDEEPDLSVDAAEGITTLAVGKDIWLSGSADNLVRQYAKGETQDPITITSAKAVPIRCVAVDPKSQRVAVTSDEMEVKVISLEDTTDMKVLSGHRKAVRRVTWHPSGSLMTTCGADGRIIVWNMSGDEPKEEKVIEGVIPEVSDPESPEFSHDCSAIWHTSGLHFFVATKGHEIVTISRNTWTKASTYSDDAATGAITSLAMSRNGLYLASATKGGIFIWSTQNRRMLFRFNGALNAMVTQLAFSPSQNMLAWTDVDGVLTRWPNPIPATAPDPVTITNASASATVPVKRAATPTLFDKDEDAKINADVDLDDDMGIDLDNDDWILDDLGDGMIDDEKKWSGKDGIREMVSVTKAQPAFQPGSTPMENKKRYLAYNMVGVIEVTDQDTHHIVNVEFHDRSARKSYHFTDHFKYDLASLGERGALYACQPENDHPAHVMYKPYGLWASQGEWTYELPKGTKVLGIAAGGPPPTKSLRMQSDADIQGNGNAVIATSDGELIFLTGGGVERCCLSLQGDYVSMVAGPEWVFIVHRDGSTTMDGSQNLTGRLIKFDDYCLLQKDTLPIAKGQTLKWIGISEEGAPVIYDSSGVLNALPRFRLPFAATWTRVLNTNALARREGKQESYWPVGVSGETFMCLILKGRQEHPEFPRPLIQELPLQLPFKRTETKDGQLEEHLARETMLLDIIRDGLGDELGTDEIARRELALDKEIIQLIQSACKADKLARAIDLVKLLHHTASFEMAIKVAQFYHLLGLREKIEALRDDREDGDDRLEKAREKRRDRERDFVPVAPPRQLAFTESSSSSMPKPFSDFRPPPMIHRPGLERAGPSGTNASTIPTAAKSTQQSIATSESTSSWDLDDSQFQDEEYVANPTPDGKRKRSEEREVTINTGAAESKRRAVGSEAAPQARANPFARKPGADTNARPNPFSSRPADTLMNQKSLHKSESFFTKVDAAEADKSKRPLKGKAKEKKESGGRQTTLFGLPPPAPPSISTTSSSDKKTPGPGRPKKKQPTPAPSVAEETQQSTVIDSQATEIIDTGDSQATEMDVNMGDETQRTEVVDGNEDEPIEWPESPAAGESGLPEVEVGA
ncbi:hypothetical protein BXZ70DRAFT_1073548 [Cristinia sonorae]|uniref:Minichromosome loss protein Mcl1 middle region domain-containing protein n=1 Tax=Cristinia sonorae TaxID=1940300 RepID=A0A8K0UHD8_9AGAR|nr:hypothetical protein BXZ70DRAFT_1073548 [Cristinia sonorae]